MRAASKGRYSSLRQCQYGPISCRVRKMLTSLLGKGAQTCVCRVVVLGVMRLTSSREVAAKGENIGEFAQRRQERGSVGVRE